MTHTTMQMVLDSGAKLTPMMQQYFEIKKNYQDMIVLFRMGDFYEVFFDDAVQTSKILNIALTHRGKIGELPVPMAGIPHHAASAYVDKITSQGMKVAIAEQVEDPKLAQGIVKRAVTQVVSPGMPYDLEKTNSKDNHYITTCFYNGKNYFVTHLDFTNGDFIGFVSESKESFLEKIRLFNPKELVTYMGQFEEIPELELLIKQYDILPTYLSEEYFDAKFSASYLERLIPSYKSDKTLKLNKDIVHALGALSYYIFSTQKLETLHHLRPFHLVDEKKIMSITLPTLQGLEILPKTRESYKDSLLGFMDRTSSALGSRMLKRLFIEPLDDLEGILQRQNLVSYLSSHREEISDIRDTLSDIRDIERVLAKITTKKANGGDLINIKIATNIYFDILKKYKKLPKEVFKNFKPAEKKILTDLSTEIDQTINDEIGANLEKGNLIKSGFNKKRDRLAKLAGNANEELSKLEEKYRKKTGIQKLKIKSNNVAGFFIEVSKTHTSKVPKSFERRQTLVNSERYTTKELTELEKESIAAKEKLERLEREIFNNLVEDIASKSQLILELSSNIGLLDAFSSIAWVSLQEEFQCPKISSAKRISLQSAWHPLIKSTLSDEFIPHDIELGEKEFFGLITGPNMAGKTTVMREVAIVQILTQVGSFVPAKAANVSLCDHIFSRLGASDDILKGQSTFMVEMAETAEIIRHASERSLIILDEVGRGTSTYDGLSIAWSLVEYFIENIKAMTLFATHYHELIELADNKSECKNLTVETINKNGEVKFLYRLIEGAANQSFGIHVAKMAGLPSSILTRSKALLKKLENEQNSRPASSIIESNDGQLEFFSDDETSIEAIPPHLKEMQEEIHSLDLMNMTPLEAMKKLYDLKNDLGKSIQ